MRIKFEMVHNAVAQDVKGNVEYPKGTLIEVPGLSQTPLRVKYTEFAGVVAGVALNDDNTPAGKIIGYAESANKFQIVAVKPENARLVDAVGGSAWKHINAFANRLSVTGSEFNREYAI